MNRTRRRAVLLPLFALAAAAVPAARADEADLILNPAVLHEVRIAMDPADWRALRDNFRSNQYYAANVTFDGRLVEQVGIRSRGQGSRSAEKPALKVDFNKYVSGQRFLGLKSVALKNLVQDNAMVRERLAMAVFEAMGIAAPRVSFARVLVNDEYWGVYNVVEPLESPWLDARFGEHEGTLYKYEYQTSYDFSYMGSDGGAYAPLPFQPETNENSYDASKLVDFIRTINEAPDAGYAAAVSAHIDVTKFLTYIAVENALAERDGMLGIHGMNNFYLYQHPGQSRFTLIPWDKNTSLQAADWPIDFNVARNVLARRLLQDPAQQRIYVDAVKRATENYVNTTWLLPMLESAYSLIRTSALADTKKPYPNDELELAVQGLRGIVTGRRASVAAQAP